MSLPGWVKAIALVGEGKKMTQWSFKKTIIVFRKIVRKWSFRYKYKKIYSTVSPANKIQIFFTLLFKNVPFNKGVNNKLIQMQPQL